MLAYYLHDLSPYIFRFPNGMGLHWYGLAYVLSFFLGGWLYRWLVERRYTSLQGGGIPEEQAPEVLAKYDKDGDGALSSTEFAAYLETVRNRMEEYAAPKTKTAPTASAGQKGNTGLQERAAGIIKKFDKNGDGKLDAGELEAMFAAIRGRALAQVSDFICWAAVFGVMLGGRLGWVLFYGLREDHSADHWYWPVEVWKGGMASHGGMIGLVLFTLYWSKRHHVSWTSIGDSLVVVAPVGLFLVRMANFINGELFGRPATVPWAMQFPKELEEKLTPELVQRAEQVFGPLDSDWAPRMADAVPYHPELIEPLRRVLTPRHPSQIYEALLEGVFLFSVLWFMRTRCRVPRGVLTGTFFVLYAVVRIIGEMFREPDPAWHVGPISAGQCLSFFLVILGAAFIAWGLRTQQYERAQENP